MQIHPSALRLDLLALACVALTAPLFPMPTHQACSLVKASVAEGSLDPIFNPWRLPAAPNGTSDLAFSQLFRNPIGPLGLEFTETAQSLDARPVRIVGYIVRRQTMAPNRVLLASFPSTHNDLEYGQADDLPSSTILVTIDSSRGVGSPWIDGPVVVTGTLKLGRHEEADGRVTWVRIATPSIASIRRWRQVALAPADVRSSRPDSPSLPPETPVSPIEGTRP